MLPGFGKLSETQFQITKDALTWITVLIAGADGEIEPEETQWATKVAKIRSYHNPNELTPFYEAVGPEFSDKLKDFIGKMPKDLGEREAILIRKLSQLNSILPLLENNLGHHLIASYRSFAKHVAKASGGFLGFFSINADESKFIGLTMLKDIPFEEPDDYDVEEE